MSSPPIASLRIPRRRQPDQAKTSDVEPRLVNAFHYRRRKPAERSHVAAPVPGIRLARRSADRLIALEEAGDEGFFRQRRQPHPAALAVIDQLLGMRGIDDLEHRS